MIHGLDQNELKAIIFMLEKNLKEYKSVKVACESCDNFEKRICKLAGEAPPPDVQATGCPEWKLDYIPF